MRMRPYSWLKMKIGNCNTKSDSVLLANLAALSESRFTHAKDAATLIIIPKVNYYDTYEEGLKLRAS